MRYLRLSHIQRMMVLFSLVWILISYDLCSKEEAKIRLVIDKVG